ncbi:DNA repair enzyme, putative [Trypanosoma brucei gambiense DAL972]|uniref:Deoxyribodipyrimidine photolyase, putative n=1 Tax=Trypanosoma brucei gambiense (strain MHOM/CI/86/DAL972) TaxID=679716 RepID=D0A4Q0_TRYB9|nr:DNA repair enzyme, putative [Trypanosoma brucei gambiense DAL972]CBH16244.1 DNA repair enzyme, putative [Trypanosoma brucei gambiense DAL972]|eukprot:XP_011778508.1 DNA repair enzyme, putative [Trypanosoma brucei gambiense DAL972]
MYVPSRVVAVKRQRTPSQPLPAAVFIFRRDFRVTDNTGLLLLIERAGKQSLPVIPLFFFNPRQCDPDKNPYFGKACFEFLCQSLKHLDTVQLGGRLVCLRGSDCDCLEVVRSSGYDIKQLGFNRDITPFARKRDLQLEEWCVKRGVRCVTSNMDYTLLPPDVVTNKNGKPYRVFSPFYRAVLQEHFSDIQAPNPKATTIGDIFTGSHVKEDVKATVDQARRSAMAADEFSSLVDYVDLAALPQTFPELVDRGGRSEGLLRLASVASAKNYSAIRDDIPGDKTTHLSPHLKFGTISIREAMQVALLHLGKEHAFTRQLIWREFYSMLLYHNPRLALGQLKMDVALQGERQCRATLANEPFLEKYSNFQWEWNDAEFTAFKSGATGFPLVDAAVRCLTKTGWCHNRCRMLIANFLVKVLFVDWREGERWYATVAVDYDVANNSGGWLWSSGQGADAQPYFRFFNPFRQSAQHDPQAVFIKQWVPELRNVSVRTIHKWDVFCKEGRPADEGTLGTVQGTVKESNGIKKEKTELPLGGSIVGGSAYPSPIVDLKQRTKWIVERYKKHAAEVI